MALKVEIDEIPAITYTTWNQKDCKTKQIQRTQASRLMKLFIRDFLDKEKTLYSNNKTFLMRGVTFSRILLQGTVVSVDIRDRLGSERKTWVRIDDGTGCLDCMAKERPELTALQKEIKGLQEEAVHQCASQTKSAVLKASLMMIQSAKNNVNQVVQDRDFKVGDEVQILGNLSEFKEKRYCFIVSAVKIPKEDIDCDFMSSYVEEIFDFYSKFCVER